MGALVHFMGGRWLPCRHVHSFPSSSLHSVPSDNGAENDDANVFLLCVPLDDGCARALAKTGLIATMCLPTEQSPVHLGQRERKERAFPLRFFAFPDGCFARERAWIGATWKAPTRHVLCSFISRTRSLPGVSYAWTAAHREVSGRREWLCMMVWRITSARRPKFTVSSLLLLRPSTRPPYSRTVQAARCAIHPSIHPSR